MVTPPLQAVVVDPESTTLVSSYEVTLSPVSGSGPDVMETVSADVATHSFSVQEDGMYRVGVAARNFAGLSGVTYDQLGEYVHVDLCTYIVGAPPNLGHTSSSSIIGYTDHFDHFGSDIRT